jgi:hypothetical protein
MIKRGSTISNVYLLSKEDFYGGNLGAAIKMNVFDIWDEL